MSRRRILHALGIVAAAPLFAAGRAPIGTALASAATGTSARPFSFALIGDTPYDTLDEQQLAQLLSEIDPSVSFILHVGDIKSGTESCDDELLGRRQRLLAAARQPLILTPGDNEWTDCWRFLAGAFSPLERLDALRRLFFTPERLPAKPLLPWSSGIEQQSVIEPRHGFPENLRWTVATGPGAVVFVTINLPGSRNGRERRAGLGQHNAQRDAANEHWLRAAFAHARGVGASGIVIAAHANPGFEADAGLFGSVRVPTRDDDDAYFDLRRLLAELAAGSSCEILFLHGDTHRFQSNRPLRDRRGEPVKNLTRVESYGWPLASSWVRIDVTPGRTPLFNVVRRQAAPS